MLYVLLAILIVLTILSFIFNKDILSPSFLINLIFSITCCFAIVGNNTWQMEVSKYVVLIIPLMNLSILLGELGVRFLIDYINNKKGKNNQDKLNQDKISQDENSQCVSDQDKVKELKPVNKASTVKFSYIALIVISAICILAVILDFIEVVKAAYAYGYTGKPNESLLHHARLALLRDVYGKSKISIIISFFGRGAGILCLCLFINNVFSKKFKLKNVLKNLPLLIPVVCMILILALSTSRVGFLTIAIISLFMLIKSIKKNKYTIIKIAVFALLIIVVFIVLFIFLGSLRANKASPLMALCVYAGSPIVTLDVWLNAETSVSSELFLKETFWGFHYLISKFNPNYVIPSNFLEFVVLGDGSTTNVYTAYRSWINDLGVVGCVILCILLGAIFGYFKNLLENRKFKHLFIYNVIYSYYFSALMFVFTAPTITTSLFTLTHVLDLTFIVITYVLITQINKENIAKWRNLLCKKKLEDGFDDERAVDFNETEKTGEAN